MEQHYYLHRIGSDGWRRSVTRYHETNLPKILNALRHVDDMAWYLRRDGDNVIIAQSKNAEIWS